MGKSKLSFLRDMSITRKLYLIVGTMAVLIAIELGTLWFAIHTLSSVRALVSAEGLWSKAEKDAVYHLEKYYRTHNEQDFLAFQNFLSVPAGDHKTRMELLKPHPDLSVARMGFIEGHVHPDDIDGMINLLRRFHKNRYIHDAIVYWTAGDSAIGQLSIIGEQLHNEILKDPQSAKAAELIDKLTPINNELTILENGFSYTLGEGSRWMEHLILKLLFIVALSVEITGLLMSIVVSRGITRDLNELIRASNKIAKGDLTERAVVYSKDEIGKVATSMNLMTEKIVASNNELGQFAYIASHDLQEPLRTISNYTELLKQKNSSQLDESGLKYLHTVSTATHRMQSLIKGLLDYSRIGNTIQRAPVDCNSLVRDVLTDLSMSIQESNAEIIIEKLPVVMGYPELKNLFQNLLSNAVKFRSKTRKAVICIRCVELNDEYKFAVEDNGIGISSRFYDKIFTIFQKLHSAKEYEGTGIGLAHCKKIVEMHGGKLWVESLEGAGSIFYFTVPKSAL